MNLADLIEEHIKALLAASSGNQIRLKRNELAQDFGCAPSQINYVIQTRFSMERGYVVESQRGGGGYIRVIRLAVPDSRGLLQMVSRLAKDGVSQRQALDFIARLEEEGLIGGRESRIMAAVVDRAVLEVPLPHRDRLRARLLAAMMQIVLQEEG